MYLAVVTGASSGMGREFVRQIWQSYKSLDEIWLIARREDALRELCEELEGSPHRHKGNWGIPEIRKTKLRSFPLDLTQKTDLNRFRESLKACAPHIRLLVNGAGVGFYGKAQELSVEDQLSMIDLNCRALTQVTLDCLPYLARGSRILQIASGSAFCPQARFAVYAAGKAYVVSFSRALARELKERKITVTSVCPGPVDTEFFAHGGIRLPFWKRPFLADCKRVVRKALFDAESGKQLSVYGLPMKLVYWGRILFCRGV
ncbi:MAG: SDR family NAD(P)-dependent oxidoreductase [Lachnospiraceae bacterium]|jgi:short-subunit dehydrogenase|nr:SDR family NAD(P)-dependent oxidoreductase [Lachnospiraceae bacterium]